MTVLVELTVDLGSVLIFCIEFVRLGNHVGPSFDLVTEREVLDTDTLFIEHVSLRVTATRIAPVAHFN